MQCIPVCNSFLPNLFRFLLCMDAFWGFEDLKQLLDKARLQSGVELGGAPEVGSQVPTQCPNLYKNILIKIAQQEHPFGLGFLAFWKPWPQVSNPGLKFKALSVFAVKKNHLSLHSRGAGGDSVNVNAPAAVHLPERVEKCLWARKRGSVAEWTACESIPLIFLVASRSVDGQMALSLSSKIATQRNNSTLCLALPGLSRGRMRLALKIGHVLALWGTVHPCASHDLDPRHRSWCGHLSPVVSANQKSERRAEPQRQMGWSPRKPGMEWIFPPKRAEPSQKTLSYCWLSHF